MTTRTRLCRLGAGLAAVLVGMAAVGCSADDDASGGPLRAVDDAPGLTHIHGIGVNPADGSVYLAAHSGLYRISDRRASIVANRYQDTMAFTVAGPDHFFASGHPDLREELPPLLGLLESRDAGTTWTKKSLLGKADFHALRVAHGRIWGYDSTSSRLMVSKDGRRWEKRSAQVIRDFVIGPDAPETVFASNGEALSRSDDGGRSWRRSDSPEKPWLLSWSKQDDLWLMTLEGLLYHSDDSGSSWDERGELRTQPEAFVVAGDELYAASHNELYVSRDEGNSWDIVFSETSHRSRGSADE